tara:strand:+ start:163 stop:555 length:393 start_codon:yes stop_codon:yes gene_type:complete
MDKKYLAKIIAKDQDGLKLISACCFGAKVKINNLKYLKKNKIFLVFLERFNRENQKDKEILNSICKFEYVENVKSKNIDKNNKELILELFAIDLLKNNDKFEINLMFNGYSCITLSTEITEVTLEDQNKI